MLVRIAAVSGETQMLAAGAGARLAVTLVNDGEEDYELVALRLRYDGQGRGFSARAYHQPPLLPAGASLTIGFLATLPADGTGPAVIDADADLLVVERDAARRLRGAGRPFAFTYAERTGPDLAALPTLLVTTADDELDGGDGVRDVASAGGALDLSFREALAIVHNTRLPQRIAFDPVIFSASTTRPIVVSDLGDLPPLDVADAAIDGLGAEVSLAVDLPACNCYRPLHLAAPRLTVRGLTLRTCHHNTPAIIMSGADHAWLTDLSISPPPGGYCRGVLINDSAWSRLERLTILVDDQALTVDGSPGISIDGLSVRFTSRILNSPNASLRGVAGSNWGRLLLFNSPNTVISDSSFEIFYQSPIEISASDGVLIADNQLDEQINYDSPDGPLRVDASRFVTLTRNLVTRPSNEPISLVGDANDGILPPTINAVETSSVSGTTAAADGSTVELFADPQGFFARFLGAATVASGSFILDGLSLSPGDRVSGTVTDLEGNTSEASAPFTVP